MERTLSVDVGNKMLAEALTVVASRKGWDPDPPYGSSEVLVADRPVARERSVEPGGRMVLVCEPTAFAARCSLNAVADLLVAAVVLSDEPADLAAALDAVGERRVSIPGRVLDLAARMPLLSERQTAVLAAVSAGESNTSISRASFLSLATVKREVAALYGALGVATRSEMIAAANALGVRPKVASRLTD